MSLRGWRRTISVVSAVGLGLAALVYGYHRLAPTRFLVEARLAVLPTRRVLIVEEVIGSSLSSRQSLRFDFIDASTGERLHRTLAPLSVGSRRLALLGGSARQWWGDGDEVILVDVAAGQIVATESDIIDQNPALRGELHRSGQRDRFTVDESGALLVKGGDGLAYAIDASLLARAAQNPAQRRWRVPYEPALPRAVSDSASFTARLAPLTAEPATGLLERSCRTVSQGPCTLRLQGETATIWQLGDDTLDGKSVLAIEARDARLAYVYVANDSTLARFYGGAWLYAVELATGRVAWTRKL
jgi:hypothetical protein